MFKPDKKLVLVLAAIICIFYAIYFKPVTWQAQGDAGDYITLAKQFMGTDESHVDLSGRSPFYSLVLALFIKVLGEETAIDGIIYLQYFLIFLTAIFLYKIFEKIVTNKVYLLFLILAFMINLSTIAYGFMVISETLTLFFIVYITYLLINYKDVKNKNRVLFWLGVLSGVAVLTRFNLILLPFFIWLSICLDYYFEFRFKKIQFLIKRTVIYFFPVFLILNLWCYKNYVERGSYYLWPPSLKGSNYVVLPMVDENTKVSQANQAVLKIILQAKKRVLSEKLPITSSSFSKYLPVADFLQRVNAGGFIAMEAEADLAKYFQLKSDSHYLVMEKLKPFLEELSSQNKMNIFFMRVFSFFYSFKWTYNPLPINTKMNLNILPAIIVLLYKMIFITAMVMFLLLSFLFLLKNCFHKTIYQNYIPLTLLIMIFYFPLINAIAITYSDGNRYKYPSEPLILGMLFFYIYKLIKKKPLEEQEISIQTNKKNPSPALADEK